MTSSKKKCCLGRHEVIKNRPVFQKHGARMKCSACNVVAHQNCIGILMDKMRFTCKPTFRDVGVRQYREQTSIHHHWVHRRSEKGKCRQCGKVRAEAGSVVVII